MGKRKRPGAAKCTACNKIVGLPYSHPWLKVLICVRCNQRLMSKSFKVDEDGTEDGCRWCGFTAPDLLLMTCDSCRHCICRKCTRRNLGTPYWKATEANDHHTCVGCDTEPIKQLQEECAKLIAQRSLPGPSVPGNSAQRVVVDLGSPPKRTPGKTGRRNIRAIIPDEDLEDAATEDLMAEEERRRKYEQIRTEREKMARGHESQPVELEDSEDEEPCEGEGEGEVINLLWQVDVTGSEPEIKIAPGLSKALLPHQLDGVRFMWENCIETVEKAKIKAAGKGCILAHSMGLGKTLQVITFLHTCLTRTELGLRTALVVLPVNVLHNWSEELGKWQARVPKDKRLPVWMFDCAPQQALQRKKQREKLLADWQSKGGVLLIGYAAYRICCKPPKRTEGEDVPCTIFQSALQNPGPDILVCDEGHLIKNPKSGNTKALELVQTKRRIFLTGSPLQNNLMEYYCMVNFVREGVLRSKAMFRNQFVNPIVNGQQSDSTAEDVKKMKGRLHVLHNKLKSLVQRKGMELLQQKLPPKTVYVVSVRLSAVQRELYRRYLESRGFNSAGGENLYSFTAVETLKELCNHPEVLFLGTKKKRGALEPGQSSDPPEVEASGGVAGQAATACPPGDMAGTSEGASEVPDLVAGVGVGKEPSDESLAEGGEGEGEAWWQAVLSRLPRGVVEMSGKMVVLLDLLRLCGEEGEKVLVFSQSVKMLDCVESVLNKGDRQRPEGEDGGPWEKDREYYRLDGQTASQHRQELVHKFNSPGCKAKCVLVSTRAGCLGINLVAASRVVLIDGCWNPTHDAQAISRAWRIGQTKPVYVYRFLTCGTLEEKIYNRQLSKESLSARVVDKHHVGRHLRAGDCEELLELDEEADTEPPPGLEMLQAAGIRLTPPVRRLRDDDDTGDAGSGEDCPSPTAAAPRRQRTWPPAGAHRSHQADTVMGRLIDGGAKGKLSSNAWIVGYHLHDPLLKHLEEEKLSLEEMDAAERDFHQETGPATNNVGKTTTTNEQPPE